ncbi:MAG: hypothetical protein ABF443_05850 [Acetobacter malorum]|uniref:hypothetical protein n=1 Tax=Acetobacter malorum TaxID=178901 RepID=UPI0039EBA234
MSVHSARAKWIGILLLCASLCLEIMRAENAAFAVVFWVLGLGFAVIVAALVQTGKRMVQTRAEILTPAAARQHAPSGPHR